jgi:hypothetical protein
MKQPLKESNPFSNLIKNFFSRFLILFAFLHSIHLFSQDTTKTSVKEISRSTEKKKIAGHSPKKAMIFSAVIPGLGQAYNRKYWKIPIVYAAIGTTTYFVNYNNKLYREYKRSYISKTFKDTLHGKIFDPHPEISASQAQVYEVSYHKNRDLFAMLTVFGYILNIADAYVDAHLKTFDVSDNLSMRFFPSINLSCQKSPVLGLTMSLRF